MYSAIIIINNSSIYEQKINKMKNVKKRINYY